MRTPIALFVLALAVRAVLVALFPDPAYPDSYYYVEVARSIAAGNGLNVDFIWIFAEVGGRIPTEPVLPIPSNAHWLPLASLLQAPFISLLGPTPVASAIPGLLIGSLAAPLTWTMARDFGSRETVARAAGVLVAIPGAVTVFMAQPETFGISIALVPATLWAMARGLRGDGRAFALAGLLAGVMGLLRNDGVLLAGTIALVWLADRLRWLRNRRGGRSWTRVEDRPPIAFVAALAAAALFLLVVGPWWARQLAVFGSISPTSSTGAALWIKDFSEWNSITADVSLRAFLAQGWAEILASRLDGLTAALTIFAVLVCSVVLVPFLLLGALAKRGSRDFQPWFAYTFVVFAGATLLYPVHVPGGTFIHTAIGLLPGAMILSIEGVLALVSFLAGRRRAWDERIAGSVLVWGVVALVVVVGVIFGRPVQVQWEIAREQRVAVARDLDAMGVPRTDRLLSIDAGGFKYYTGRPGVVTPDDPIETIEAVARAYGARWLIVERADAARALGPVLAGDADPAWIGDAVFEVPHPDGGSPRLALFPVCTQPGDDRC
ncbi:MAG TPA: glycosyltransferase family 39 protein [Candidatus Binatia bacterium]|nr:glycosyltransferase family 39 protein [Candidatus Binatia bacterium]